MPSKRRPAAAALIAHLRELGLRRYPGAHEKSPWPGHRDLAVNDKTFAYLSAPGDPCGLSLKLPFSRSLALDLPGAEPTPYGLGKSGWVSLTFADDAALPPTELLESWLDESYRAQAPKKLLAAFESGAADMEPVRPAAGRAAGSVARQLARPAARPPAPLTGRRARSRRP
jgi:predicted DNA-binding protein (MmcQ/YjbR family)